ncbi:MAG: ABC transporter permease [Bryobacteraceae bacterium]|jgi:predicted permease
MLISLKHAFRVLRKDPGFTAVAICSLALGIGATSAAFSFADALLLRPLPVREPDRVVAISNATSGAFGSNTGLSYPDYVDLRDHNRSFDGLVASGYATFGFSPAAGAVPRMRFGLYVSGNFFRVLGVEPSLGRGFRSDEDQAEGRDPVVVLSHGFWTGEFGGSPSVLGSRIRLNGIEFEVIGAAPEHFTSIDQFMRPALYVPLAMWPRMGQQNNLHRRDVRWLAVRGRLRPGASVDQAQADIGVIAAELQKMYPQSNRDQRTRVETEVQRRVEEAPPNAVLVGMLGLLALCVLLVACANVAGLLLSRARARSREIAVRLAIGAGRGALVRQLLLENLLVAVAGGLGGVAVADAGAELFRHLPMPTDLPFAISVVVDRRVLLFTLVVSLLSTLLFGLAPALRITRPDLVPALKAADADSGGRRRLWGRHTIVAGQVALSLVLLVISAVLVQGFRDQLAQGPGFRTDRLYLTSFDTQLLRYSEDQTRRFYKDLLQRTRSTAGVRSAALTSVVPLWGLESAGIVPEGYRLPPGKQAFSAFGDYVSDGYFGTLGVRILEGRGFLESDGENAPLVAVVNDHMASHYWVKEDALGQRLHLGSATGPLAEVVGVAKAAKHFFITEPPLDVVYLPFRQYARSALTLVAESEAQDAATLAPALREVVRGLDRDMPVFDVRTMKDFYANRAVKMPNLIVQIVAGMGLMGMLLATVGLYGLVAYSVSRRTREMGIRMAIGADRREVVWMVLRQGLGLGAAGVAAGLVVSVFACRAITSATWFLTFDRVNPLIFAVIPLALLAITALAAWAPARRATAVDPMRTLRDE